MNQIIKVLFLTSISAILISSISVAAQNSGPGPAYGNTGAQELGDAVYDHYDPGWISGYNYNHAGIYAGFNGDLNNHALEAGTDGDWNGVFEHDFYNSFVSEGDRYYGAYSVSSTGLTFSQRKEIVDIGRDIADGDVEIGYVINLSLFWKGDFFDGEISDIDRIRCDGTVEYAYEKAGSNLGTTIRVWNNVNEGHWNIVLDPDSHNNFPGNTRDPHFELSPWAQRGAPPDTGPISAGFKYSGPPWPDTNMIYPAPVERPEITDFEIIEQTASSVRFKITAEYTGPQK